MVSCKCSLQRSTLPKKTVSHNKPPLTFNHLGLEKPHFVGNESPSVFQSRWGPRANHNNLFTIMNTPTKKSENSGKAVTPEVHRETLLKVLQCWLEIDDKQKLKGVRTHQEIMEFLVPGERQNKVQLRYKSQKERSALVRREDLHGIIKMALSELGVTIQIANDATAGFEQRKAWLKSHYKLRILGVPTPKNEAVTNIFEMYREAAVCFNEAIEEVFSLGGIAPKVAIGGGQSILGMIDYIMAPPGESFSVYNLNYATRLADRDIHDSSYLASAITRLCRNSTAHVMSLPPIHTYNLIKAVSWHSFLYENNDDIKQHFRDSLDPDIVFVGTGNFHKESPTINRFYQSIGIDYDFLKEYNPVGDINLCFFDAQGLDLTPQLLESHVKRLTGIRQKIYNGSFFKNEKFSHPFILGLNMLCLRKLVLDQKLVTLVAGGHRSKVDAIHTLLETKAVNGLVTDPVTMEHLYNRAFRKIESMRGQPK